MDEPLENLYRRALETVIAYRRGNISWDQMMMRFPDDESYEDEDLSELQYLVEHEPGPGLLPSGKKSRRDWEEQTRRLMVRMAARAGIDGFRVP